jgi:hypothetical protein
VFSSFKKIPQKGKQAKRPHILESAIYEVKKTFTCPGKDRGQWNTGLFSMGTVAFW